MCLAFVRRGQRSEKLGLGKGFLIFFDDHFFPYFFS